MEFEKIEQRDFSGGINFVDDPINLAMNEVADARNIRVLAKDVLSERLGYTEYNSTAIGASTEIRSLFQFESYDGTFVPLCQTSGSKIYYNATAFPGTTTTWTQAIAETSGASPAIIDAMWGKAIICNNVDGPLVWEGPFGKIAGCKRSIDTNATYQDWYIEVVDRDTTTHMPLDAQPAAAGAVYIKSYVPKLTGIDFTVDTTNKNGNASVMTVKYWNGSAWAAVSGGSDGTKDVATSTKTLNISGTYSFTEATTTASLLDGDFGFWWQVTVSDALSATVDIIAIRDVYNMQLLQNLWDGGYFAPAGFKTTSDTSVTIKDWTQEVTDGALSTVALLGALTVTTGAVYVQSAKKFRGIRITMSTTNVNTNAVTMTAKYWDGDSWESLTIVDGTSANSKTLAQSGDTTFTWPANVRRRLSVDELMPTYQIQLLFSAALSANVDVAEIELLEYTEPLRPHALCTFHKNRLWLINRTDTPNFLYYSAEFGPEVFNGSDSGYIGIPSGHPIIAVERFFNELAIFTPDEIYLLEGSSPLTFGLLKINTGGVGCVAPKSVVAVGKFIYFFHATGFYRFDGIGVTNLSVDKVRGFFDDTDTTNFIPTSRYAYVQGRFDRVHNTVEWTVSRGSAQTSNNLIIIFDVTCEAWYLDDIVAASLLKTISSAYQDLWYHGDYAGKVHRDQSGTSDNGTAISAYVTSRGFAGNERGEKITFRGVKMLLDTVSSASTVTVSYAMSGNSSFTTLGTPSLVQSGTSHIWRDLYQPATGTCVQIKIAQATKDKTFTLYSIIPFIEKIREVAPTP